MTAKNDAKFWKDGKIQETPGKDVMRNAEEYDIYPAFAFYAFPNRDSSIYKERYNIPEAHTIIRGSLRYKGYTHLMRTLVDMGFISLEERDFLKKPISWKEATKEIIGASSSSQE
jgi:saccharopine dehydrogenase (NADP+, L-glutamate forming)